MPIRHCQKCSLKVLIDDAQASVTPFYCQRCTAALKGDSSAGAAPTPAPAVARRQSSPQLTPVPASTAVAVEAPPASKPGTVKVFCPYCKASFNGRIPAKPARGSCPLCQKDLILLPTGDIRPAADFDLAKWQAEQSGGGVPKSAKESGTVALVKKFAADPQATAAKAEAGKRVLAQKSEPPPPAAPADETQPNEEGVELPSWLDDESKRMGQKQSSAPVVPPPETDTADAVRIEELDSVDPEPVPKRSPPPVPTKASSSTAALPSVPDAVEDKPSPKRGTGRRERTERRALQGAVDAPQGAGKFLLALLLTFLPVGACPFLLSSKEKLEESLLKPMGARFVKGFQALDAKLFPVEEAPAPAPKPMPKAEPAPEAPAAPTAEDKKQMRDEIDKRWTEYKREERTFTSKSTGATPAEKAEFKDAENRIKDMKTRYDELRANYRKIFGEDYDPRNQ